MLVCALVRFHYMPTSNLMFFFFDMLVFHNENSKIPIFNGNDKYNREASLSCPGNKLR